MKQLRIRGLAMVVALGCGSMAQGQSTAPAAPPKSVSGASAGTAASAKPPEKARPETKYKAFVDRQKADEAGRREVEAKLRKIRRDRAVEAEKEKDAQDEREEKGHTPIPDDAAKKDSTGTKK
jgi:hypothetical protein